MLLLDHFLNQNSGHANTTEQLHDNEVMRAYKTVADTYVEPISFIVPRRAEVFQEDIYPPTVGIKPAMSAGEWLSGKEALPPKISLESVYEGGAPKEVPADHKPPAQTPIQSPPPTKTEVPKAQPRAEPVPAQKDSTQSMKDNKASMSAMASRFADRDEEPQKDDDDDSSFEEISKPVERPSATTTRMEEKTRGPAISKEPERPAQAHRFIPPVADPPTSTPTPAPAPSSTSSMPPPSTAGPTASEAAGGLKAHLQDIKEQQSRLMAMLEAQNRMMSSQSEQIANLTEEVDSLKGKVGSGGGSGSAGGRDERDEKIRRLELELEEMRS